MANWLRNNVHELRQADTLQNEVEDLKTENDRIKGEIRDIQVDI